ncbi:NUDIX hydrolase [Haloarcula sp. CBA1127]|uniref:NUDIX hydrolase n=1 Tax=Haloarcula sp. CBA1127 TaxID=1765055 RepID=UPI00073EA0B9|nr:NUDIX hydrolase [Haloarcula sp. CBA1127]
MSTEVNRERVRQHKERLLSRYDAVNQCDVDEVVSDELFDYLRAVVADGYVGSGYVWVVRTPVQAVELSDSMGPTDQADAERVLLILHRGNTTWTVPGGGVESGESFDAAAVREVREETAIECDIQDCFRIEHWRTEADSYDERLHSLRAYFDGHYADGSISIQPSELNGAAWVETRPRAVDESLERRVDEWFDG